MCWCSRLFEVLVAKHAVVRDAGGKYDVGSIPDIGRRLLRAARAPRPPFRRRRSRSSSARSRASCGRPRSPALRSQRS
eukprot:3914651-Alexandrium_andersonii.AAC.1